MLQKLYNKSTTLPCKRGFLHLLRTSIAVVSLQLAFISLFAQTYTVDTVRKSGDRANRINLVYLSDGYQSSELNTFGINAQTINNALFGQTPFAQYKNFFNIFDIQVPSAESGAKHPGNATDESTSGGQPIADPNNIFQSTFDYFLIHRLLVPQNDSLINVVLANNLPDYDQAFVVVNSPYYGGSGGAYATASTDPYSSEVAVHEIGHSFAGLADEYWAGEFYARETYNMTQNNNPATIRWKDWLNINNIGIIPYGSAAPENTWYHPHPACKMQYLGYPFCSVCTERFVDHIHELVNMVDSYSPLSTSFTLSDTSATAFSVANIQTEPATITVNWYINGSAVPFAIGVNGVSVPYASFVNTVNTVTAEVVDSTSLSKSFLPSAGYINSITWTVTKGALPVTLSFFRGSVNAQNQGMLSWQVLNRQQVQSFDIERSKDGITYTKLATINSEINQSNYSYTDRDMLIPYGFYRLVMRDKEGKFTYSNVIKLSNASDKLYYKVYQNADAHTYHLTCMFANEATVLADITTVNGTTVLRKDFGKKNTQLDYDFSLAGKAAGIYFMNLYIDNRKHTVKLIAQ